MDKETETILRQYVIRTGRMYENFGFPRICGEIGALLYLRKEPLSLDEISQFLEISKGSASTNTRALERMKFVKPIRIPKDRKDYYQFSGDLWPSLQESLKAFLFGQVEDFKKMNDESIPIFSEKVKHNHKDKEQLLHMSKQLKDLNQLFKLISVMINLVSFLKDKSPSFVSRMVKKITWGQ